MQGEKVVQVQQQSNTVAAPKQEQVTPVAKETNTSQQEEVVDPKLRDFTLIISKLLFQLSQL